MSVPSSPLRGCFASSSAAGLSARLRAVHSVAIARELSVLSASLRNGNSEELGDLTELADGDALAEVLDELARRLTTPEQIAAQPMPAWVSIAQRSRDYVDIDDLSPLVERIVARIARRVAPGTRSFVELYVWEAQAAFEVFRQRFQIAQDIDAIVAEVFAGLAHAMRLLDEDASQVDLEELQSSFAQVLREWTKLLSDMGAVVDLELIRLFVNELAVRYRLSPRIWSLLILRLDRAFSVRADNRLEHVFGDAIEGLLGATQRFDFLRDLRSDGYAYLPPDAELWGDLVSVMIVVSLRPGSRLEARSARALNLAAVSDLVGGRWDDFEQAVRLGSAGLRNRWERNFLDLYTAGSARLLTVAKVASELAAQDLSAVHDPSVETLLLKARAAIVLGADVPAQRSLFRVGLSQVIELPNRSQLRVLAQQASGGDAELNSALKDLFELAQVSGHQAEDLAPAAAGLLAQMVAPNDPAVACLLQLFAGMHRIFDEHEARAELRAHMARTLLEGWQTRAGSELTALHAALSFLRASAHWKNSQLAKLMIAFEPSLRSVSAAVKISRVAAELADQASAAVLRDYPHYAERIGESGCAATRRDNYFTVLRLAQVLGGANASPKETMVWWWLSTIGVYLRNRDQSVMQGNLRAIVHALTPHLRVEELLICSDILTAVYRKGLAIDIPRDLGVGSVLNFRQMAERGPLWRSAFTMRRAASPHHGLLGDYLKTYAAADTEGAAVIDVWRNFAAQWQALGDPAMAWSELSAQVSQAIRAVGANRLQSAWVRELRVFGAMPECAMHHLLLAQGLERVQLVAFGLNLAPRIAELSALMGRSAHVLPETPEGRGELFAHKGERDLALLLNVLAEACCSGDQGLATLNAGRYLLECILPYVPFSEQSWASVWAVALAELLPTSCAPVSAAAQRCFALLNALTRQADMLRAVGQEIFVPTLPVFSDDPAQEAEWRALASGLMVAAAAADAGLPGEALAQSLALATPLFAEQAVTLWQEAKAPLCALLGKSLSPSLRSALDGVCAALDRTLGAERIFQGAPASSALDLALALRSADPYSLAIWRCDRVTRVQREGLTTPLPGDLTMSRASGWQCPEMLAIRRAISHLSECTALAPQNAAPGRQDFQLGLQRLAWSTAFLRDGMGNALAPWLTSSLLGGEWYALDLPTLVAWSEACIGELDERFGDDSTLVARLHEALASLWLPTAATQSAAELPVRQGNALEQRSLASFLLGQSAPNTPEESARGMAIVHASGWFQRLTTSHQARVTSALRAGRYRGSLPA